MRWQKDKDPLAPREGAFPRGGARLFQLGLLGLLVLGLTATSFFLWREGEGTGEISRAVSYFEEFFDRNEAIAVFLGWEGQ